ncbi:MAG: metallophosphoesterase family protein [Actinobacteria bacterium]|nr:metallophosphoesterase family protein [Actinomycetota bacterium]
MLTRRTALSAIVALPVVTTLARAIPAQARSLLGIVVEPTPVPDRIALNPTSSPSSSVSITWRTNDATTSGLVEYVAGDGTVRTAPVSTTTRVNLMGGPPAARHHTAALEGLAPGTPYDYRVGSPESGWSSWHSLTTASTIPAPGWTFLYFGDAQIGLDTVWPVNVERALAAYPDAALSLHAGDLINNADNDEEWAHWFSGAGALAHDKLVIASPGNHEYSGDQLLQQYKGHFEMPGNGPAFHQEDVWFCDYQGVRFISLNGNAPLGGPDQAIWMRKALRENPGRWSVVTFHQPMFSATPDRDNPLTRATWLPVFEEEGVDLVLQGHDHTYARGHLAANDAEEEGAGHRGPTYVVSNGGGKYYDLAPAEANNWTDNDAVRVVGHEGLTCYQGIEVYDDRLVYRSHVGALRDEANADGFEVGDLVDAFTVVASPDGKVVRDGVHLGPWAEPEPEPEPEPDPERVTPTLRISQHRRRLAVRVTSPGAKPSGRISVWHRGERLRSRKLTGARAEVKLPKKMLGSKVTVRYGGDRATAPARVRLRLDRRS